MNDKPNDMVQDQNQDQDWRAVLRQKQEAEQTKQAQKVKEGQQAPGAGDNPPA